MYIKSIEIEDFKNYRSSQVAFQNLGGEGDLKNINLLLGTNGAGKTGVLQAICLSVLSGMLPNAGFIPRNLVRSDASGVNPEAAVLNIEADYHYDEEALAETRIDPVRGLQISQSSPQNLFSKDTPHYFLLGYGASRWVPLPSPSDTREAREQTRHPRYQRVAGLFETGFGLMPLESWIYTLAYSQPQDFGKILDLINCLLPDEIKMVNVLSALVNHQSKGDKPVITFERFGVRLPLHAYSDGYRAYISWINDLVYHLWTCTPNGSEMTQMKGVVLIDEIGLHLHPSWAQRILRKLSDNLPNLQFICTSHNPLIAGSLRSENLLLVENDDQGLARVSKPEHSPLGLDADQILKSELFNMDSTRDPFYQDAATDLYQRVLRGDRGAALDLMRLHSQGAEAIEEEG